MNTIKLDNFKYVAVRAELNYLQDYNEFKVTNTIEALFRFDDEVIEYVDYRNNACDSNTKHYFYVKL